MSKFSGNREDGRRGLSFFGGFWFDIVQVDCRAVVLVFDQKINVEEVIVKIQVVSQIVGFGVLLGELKRDLVACYGSSLLGTTPAAT